MPSFTLKKLTRGQAIVEYNGHEYNVNGEGYGDGTWEIFPKMVYQLTGAGEWKFLENDDLKAEIVSALRENWSNYHPAWSLLPEKE